MSDGEADKVCPHCAILELLDDDRFSSLTVTDVLKGLALAALEIIAADESVENQMQLFQFLEEAWMHSRNDILSGKWDRSSDDLMAATHEGTETKQ